MAKVSFGHSLRETMREDDEMRGCGYVDGLKVILLNVILLNVICMGG